MTVTVPTIPTMLVPYEALKAFSKEFTEDAWWLYQLIFEDHWFLEPGDNQVRINVNRVLSVLSMDRTPEDKLLVDLAAELLYDLALLEEWVREGTEYVFTLGIEEE